MPTIVDETAKAISEILDGTAPMSKWMASVDYNTFADFEEYLKAQLRDVLDVKVRLDAKGREDEELASFIDGRVHSLDQALATYRVVMQREAAESELALVSGSGLAAAVNAAIDGYVQALLDRKHGGVAADRALTDICRALGRDAAAEYDAARRSPHPHKEANNGR